jgi:hypothetical protein
LENALHHGGGTVVIRRRTTGTTPGGSVVIEVSDEGPGIPEELGARVFERAVSGRSGTGLGLALARDLAEAGGGRLELISRRPATFAVFLPRVEDTRQREAERGSTTGVSAGSDGSAPRAAADRAASGRSGRGSSGRTALGLGRRGRK